MQAFILIGDTLKQQEYLSQFQKENGVPSYLLVQFETFKILDARALQKTLSLKLREDEKRMVTISNPTLDAQHALLKTVEELPESSYVFFLTGSKDDVIPTIVSRTQEIFVGDKEEKGDKGAKTTIKAILDNVGDPVTLEDVEQVIYSTRELLKEQLRQNSQEALSTFPFLKRLHENYKLAKNNNVNKKMVLDISFTY